MRKTPNRFSLLEAEKELIRWINSSTHGTEALCGWFWTIRAISRR